jgi:hypothetical protein
VSTKENMIESIIDLLNQHFEFQIEHGEHDIPYVRNSKERSSGSITEFSNDLIRLIEKSETDGKINYYFDNELDFDTPEEYHRH